MSIETLLKESTKAMLILASAVSELSTNLEAMQSNNSKPPAAKTEVEQSNDSTPETEPEVEEPEVEEPTKKKAPAKKTSGEITEKQLKDLAKQKMSEGVKRADIKDMIEELDANSIADLDIAGRKVLFDNLSALGDDEL